MKVIIKDIIKKPRFLFLRLDRDVMSDIYNKNKKFNLKKGFTNLINGKKKCIISCGFCLTNLSKIKNK